MVSVHFRNLIWFDVYVIDLQSFAHWCYTSRGIWKIRWLSIHVYSFPAIPSCVCASSDSGCWTSGAGCAEASSAMSNSTPHQHCKIPEVKNLTISTPPVSYAKKGWNYNGPIIVAHVHPFFYLYTHYNLPYHIISQSFANMKQISVKNDQTCMTIWYYMSWNILNILKCISLV